MFFSFPSIQSFHHIYRNVELYPTLGTAPVTYRAKVKLHGLNTAVQIRSSGIFAQSRNEVLGVGQGLCGGFAEWVDAQRDQFASLYRGEDFCIYGEWCGPGIMNKAAISQIPHKLWVPYLIQYGASDDWRSRVVVNPAAFPISRHPEIIVLDWYGPYLTIDWRDEGWVRNAVEMVNRMVAEVEECDPFVRDHFGIKGIGEGLVFYPTTVASYERMAQLLFKAKGEEHRVVRTKAAQMKPEVVATIDAFVDLFVTEARLQQALNATGGVAAKRYVGPFLAWIADDVRKESQLELAGSGLQWRMLKNPVKQAARRWYLEKCSA
jgi:hypothetical protein